ncbi:hypothetical protein CROQUDRAFT_655471 [Cronartium quercuum f. sp. fusiforme G11]|uniref:Uncharacterized protein n=1 Tax=Cronartium quercuum f. sp. fusiforme G11 TaxID=708437 RepID=A0A9P6NLS1_9BASI|nr:hypothetical protein CROQUDRAFT_655471 [Cronartium quercuum f. sp. fusiforme G11]
MHSLQMVQIPIYNTITAKVLVLVRDVKEIGSAGTSSVHLNNEKSLISGQKWTMSKGQNHCES